MYSYNIEKNNLYTHDGIKALLRVRDKVNRLLNEAGAFRLDKAVIGTVGDVWLAMACVDKLVELGEIREIPTQSVQNNRVFVKA